MSTIADVGLSGRLVDILDAMNTDNPEPPVPSEGPRLVPDNVREWARQRRDGLLTGKPLPSGFLDNDPKLDPYLESVAEGDDEMAIKRLAWTVLAGWPHRIHHEYVRWQLEHLRALYLADYPPGLWQRAGELLAELIKGWVFGFVGWDVEVKPPAGHPGQAPTLFPHIDEDSPDGSRDQESAEAFRRLWDDLMSRFDRIGWRSYRNEYGEGSPVSQEHTITALAADLMPLLKQFRTDYNGPGRGFLSYCGLAGAFPSDAALHQMVRTALEDQTGHPRDTFGYHFVAHFGLVLGGWELMESRPPMKAAPSTIRSTLRTLAARKKRASRSESPKDPHAAIEFTDFSA